MPLQYVVATICTAVKQQPAIGEGWSHFGYFSNEGVIQVKYNHLTQTNPNIRVFITI